MMKKHFLTGLVTLLPLAVTIWLIVSIVHFLTKPFMGLMLNLVNRLPHYGILATEQGIRASSEILILICLFLFILGLGLIARRFFFHSLIKLGDRILDKIPLVNKVYKTSKEIVQSIFNAKGESFKQVVLLPFPYKGSLCLGLIANSSPETCSDAVKNKMVSVFIPTTPNPTTGFLVMIPKEELIFLEMKSEDAIKYVVSCAVIQPGIPKK